MWSDVAGLSVQAAENKVMQFQEFGWLPCYRFSCRANAQPSVAATEMNNVIYGCQHDTSASTCTSTT